MRVSDILKVKGNTLFTVTPDTTLHEAVNTMAEHDIGSLVVMEYGDLVGMLVHPGERLREGQPIAWLRVHRRSMPGSTAGWGPAGLRRQGRFARLQNLAGHRPGRVAFVAGGVSCHEAGRRHDVVVQVQHQGTRRPQQRGVHRRHEGVRDADRGQALTRYSNRSGCSRVILA